tara:strand:+ start:1414 stop:1929 length:516 start_codon:yes stop_codon:yes gene_type:complete
MSLNNEEIQTLARQYFAAFWLNEYENAYSGPCFSVEIIINDIVNHIDTKPRPWRKEWSEPEAELNFYRYYMESIEAFSYDFDNTVNEHLLSKGKDFFEQHFIIDRNKISNMENYILQELDTILDEDHQKEMAARGVIYRACSKAIWNPRCEMGKRMIMKRLEKDGLSEIIE